MKRHIQSMIGIVSLLFAFVVVSCMDSNTEKVVPKDSSVAAVKEDEIFSINGILGFTSSKAFRKYIEEDPLSNQSIRTQFEQKFKYTSMQSSYEKSLALDSLKQSEYVQKNGFASFEQGHLQLKFGPSISNIVNNEGLILIGSRLYRLLKDEVRSISIANKRSLAEAISILKKNGKAVVDVQVDSIKHLPISIKNDISVQNNRVGVGSYSVTSNEVILTQNPYGLTERFRTYGRVGLDIIPFIETLCETGEWVYDEDARAYVCVGPTTVTQYYVKAVSCLVYGTNNWDENNHGAGYEYNGAYVRIDGNLTVYVNGTTISVPLNNQSNSNYHNFSLYNVTTTNAGTLEVEGAVTFKTQHIRKYSMPNSPITSASLTL